MYNEEKRHFYGKTMLITGASQGIGKSIALEASRKGVSHLILVSRSKEKLEGVKEKIHIEIREMLENMTKTGKNKLHYQYMGYLTNIVVDTIVADLSTEQGSMQMVDDAQKILQSKEKDIVLDYLILNHITGSNFGLWLERDGSNQNHEHQGNLEPMFRTNTFSYIWITTRAMKTLLLDKGHIVVISSLAGHVGVPNTAVYSATKHALHGFFNALRVEFEMMQVSTRITLAAIGATDTEGAKTVMKRLPSVSWDDSMSAAKAILRGAALNKREIFHPHHKVFPAIFLYNLLPQVIDHLLRTINNSNYDN